MTFQSAKRFAKDLAKRNPKRFPKSQYAKWQTYQPISVWAGTRPTSLSIASKYLHGNNNNNNTFNLKGAFQDTQGHLTEHSYHK